MQSLEFYLKLQVAQVRSFTYEGLNHDVWKCVVLLDSLTISFNVSLLIDNLSVSDFRYLNGNIWARWNASDMKGKTSVEEYITEQILMIISKAT